MFLDGLFVLLMVLAVWKGYSKGLVIALFSLLAIIIGLAAAMKFSVLVAEWLCAHTGISGTFLPVLAFVLIMIAVGLLVRIGARLIQKGLQITMLGWLDKLGGITLYALAYAIILSVIVFYSIQLNILGPQALQSSRCYKIIAPLGPWFINALGVIIPVFKDMFADLQLLLDGIAPKE